MSISGLPHLAHFLLRSAKFHQTHLVGRLKLLEKLVEMHRDAVSTGVVGANKRISYRHLCSSLIFTRRHVYPPEQPVFPHNYVSEEAMAVCFGAGGLRRAPSSALPVQTPLKVVPQHTEVQLSSSGCLMEANIKASRLARRVFIVVARALLQEPRSVSPGNGTTSLPHAESFVNAEIALLDVSLAARLRAKLSDFLVIRAAAAAEVVASPAAVSTKHEPPPIPPPRRFSQSKPTPSESRKVSVKSDTVTAAAAAATNTTQIITPSGIRVALEPAYDHVALSETAPYSSGDDDDDEEDVEEEPLEKLDWEEVGAAQQVKREAPAVASPPPPRLPVVPTPAELSALKTALRTAASSSIPLVSIPNLAQSLDAKEPLKTEYRYREGVDWLLGPFLGKGAFSQCYQARDLRTGTLMAVKRLRFMGDSSAESMEQLATATEEVAIMRRLHHPNVLRLFGIAYNPEKRHVDIFVEWMPGGSITSLLNQYGAFTEPVSLAYILQSTLHLLTLFTTTSSQPVIVFLGANLLVDGTGSVVRISDFGASARLGTQGSVAGQFQGQVIGTFAFMAPEVLRGETYGRACDIWSVGCCLLEMLSGKPPWNDSRLTNQYALMFTVSSKHHIASADQPPSYPKSISPPVKKFLDSCFNRIPEQRPTARRLLQHPVFSSIVSAPEPPTTVSPEAAGLSKSFTTVGLCSTTRAASRHRALPPVPNEPPRSPPSGYDKLAFNVASGQQNANKQPRQHQVVTQRKICRNQ
ncbi:unnamed protein product [Mesocestoides corti]|uniref:Protein kinase domain-containing protein n=1 Tax=Mesocestoides corti TaxID=53468 RepID=A0A0R3UPE6_MESCO|nr:unnamed protein product [Mesocestoides corti]